MSDVTTVLNDQTSWETGDLVGLTAFDPAGKLIPSVDATEIASIYDNYSLAVYARIRDGTGTSIASLGQQTTGTLTGGTWAARADDGRAYLTGGSISFAYHASMAKADSDGKTRCQGGGLRFKLSSVTAQVLMTRAGRFSLGIDANLLPYFSWVHSTGTSTITALSAHIIVANTPTVLHFSAREGAAYLYKDGALVASVTGLTGINDPGTGALVVACTGVYSDAFLVGEYYNSGMLAAQRYSGTWEKTVDLGVGKDQTLRYFTIVSKKKFNHAISIAISFATTEATLDDARVYNFSVDQYETEKYHAPETTLTHGRYMKVALSLSGRNFDYQLPIVDSLTLVTRDIGTVLYEPGDLDFDDFYLPEPTETQTPESLEGALADLARLKAAITEIRQRQESVGFGFGRRIAALEKPHAALVTGVHGVSDGSAIASVNVVDSQITSACAAGAPGGTIHEAIDALISTAIGAGGTIHEAIDALISTAIGAGGVIDNAVDSLISTHAAIRVNVHGVGAGSYIAYTGAPYQGYAVEEIAVGAVTTHVANADPHSGGTGGAHYAKDSELSTVSGVANDAHADAATAISNAATAQSTANDAHTDAATAYTYAGNAHGDAATAQSRADAAYTLADAATTAAEVGTYIGAHADNCLNWNPV
jgi:hypothetical protein